MPAQPFKLRDANIPSHCLGRYLHKHTAIKRAPKCICRNQLAGMDNEMLSQSSRVPKKVDSLKMAFFENKDKVRRHSEFHLHVFRMEASHSVVA